MELTTIVIIGVLFYMWMTLNQKEGFKASEFVYPPEARMGEYQQEVMNLAAMIGPYIGETYTYLRAKYLNSFKDSPIPPAYQPGLNDPTLSDPMLPQVRVQIKAWIDTRRNLWEQMYGVARVNEMSKTWDISYVELSGKVLQVTYTQNGHKHVYLV